jgi:hypothetical protein
MAGSTTNLDLVQVAQSNKETVINSLFDAGSPATTFGRRASTSAALTWGYYGGVMLISGTPTLINNGTLALTTSATNYIEVDPLGVVSRNTTAFTAGSTPLYQVVVGTSSVTSWLDRRAFLYTNNNQPFDMAVFYPGVPTASAIVLLAPFVRSVSFPSALSGSVGKATVAATAQTDFDILKNGASVGTMRFAIAATDATFIAASPITFAAGDVIRVNAPVTPDATLANVHFTLKGTR